MARIKGISKTSLWNSWKTIRKDLRNASIRDVIDFVDYDIDPNKWILRLLQQISEDRYEPTTPLRFTLGKSNGFSRTCTQPSIPDLVLYRTIVDAIYIKALRREHAHVYFRRQQLAQAQSVAAQQAAQVLSWTTQYRMPNYRSFYNWLKYAQYRKHLLLQRVHPHFVITDISNFFDSVLHSHVEEALRGLSIAPRMVGILFFLLERLSIRQDYSSSHAISLPVDQFDCSRTLAHLTLFRHDDLMADLVGEDSYVRWMDDQNFGVPSTAAGLRVLSKVGSSLARLHLSPNTKKSEILTLAQARRHFHLDLNEMLDKADATAKLAKTRNQRSQLSKQLKQIWSRARQHEDTGEFDKVLKRVYGLAGFTRLRFLRRRAHKDVLANPSLIDRVCDYMRCSGTVTEYLAWAQTLMHKDEQIYPDINVALIESFLRLETNPTESRQIRLLASSLLSGKGRVVGIPECKSLVPLLLLRFGDKRSLPSLEKAFTADKAATSAGLLRAAAVVYSSFGDTEFASVRKASSRLLSNPLADVVRLVERIRKETDVPVRFKARVQLRYDAVAKTKFVDMRALLTVKLLNLSRAKKVGKWFADWKAKCLSERISNYDRRLIRRLV
ncbi:MAG: RNA-directed DNA polymerase [Silvibacterium sp.]